MISFLIVLLLTSVLIVIALPFAVLISGVFLLSFLLVFPPQVLEFAMFVALVYFFLGAFQK